MDWQEIDLRFVLAIIIALSFVLFIGGHYWKLKKEITEAVVAFKAVSQAIQDPNVNDAEISRLIDRAMREAKDVGVVLKNIAFSVAQLLSKK